MRNDTARLYVAALTLLGFFVLWAAIAARPWSSPVSQPVDPRLLALSAREHRLQREAVEVKRLVARRWARYERQLRARRREIAVATQRHQQALAAARLAALRAAAAQQSAAPVSSVSYASPAAASAPASAPAPRVVTLPPQVQTVTLPAVTSTGSSH